MATPAQKKKSDQHTLWEGKFGDDYLKRNKLTSKGLDKDWIDMYGVSRFEMNEKFLSGISKDARILEIGSNFGMQLQALQDIGYTNLYGIELNPKTVDIAQKLRKGITIIRADAIDIPFKDNFFDMVFTSGVLIHIGPQNIKKVIREMHRVSKKHIWGFEYYAPMRTEIVYRGHHNVLWKAPFAELFLKEFSDLRLVHSQKYPYTSDKNLIDEMFLLRKGK